MELRKINKNQKKGNRHLYKRKSRAHTYIMRSLLVFATLILLLVIGVVSVVATVAHGPSETIRNTLVLSAMQASATKWVPGLFLGDELVADILEQSSNVTKEVISFDDYKNNYTDTNNGGSSSSANNGSDDEWADAVNGMKLITITNPTYKGYLLLVRDPSRVYVGTSSDFTNTSVEGVDIFTIVNREGCIAATNAGEFNDPGGVGTGNTPIGLTYSKGECVWSQSTQKTFIGIDKNNKLVVFDDLTKAEADEIGVRDGVCFQTTSTENILISNDGSEVTLHKVENNTAVSQRTAIGQRADGTMIFLVTDGRSAASMGATYNDVIDVMVKYGAVTAAMLDGGSSSMLYYEKYWEVYDEDYNYDTLDKYQKKGLVNNYKAFTMPRQIPTFFCIAPEA
ncbi:MAG: phosphodiester glycosidase family protein [Clostridia bacterium]|nr:phosphodiester glycosidase family protein [Clostridia bacterium]